MDHKLSILDGKVVVVKGKGKRQVTSTVFNQEQVAAIRLVIQDELDKLDHDREKEIFEENKAGFDEYNGF